jgi:hypothetical protein
VTASQVQTNVRWGVKGGLLLATVYSAFAIISGLSHSGGSPRVLSLAGVVSIYYAGGCVCGAIVGALRPLTRTQWGAFAVGAICGAPVFMLALPALGGRPMFARRKTDGVTR